MPYILAGDFRKGITFELDSTVQIIVDFQHVKPGKGGAFVRTKLRDVKNGRVVDYTFRSEKFEEVRMEEQEKEYLYDDAALEKYRKTHTGSFTLQRYKGLGEMDAEQLWETTLDPARRILKQVEIEDGRMASDVTEMLMGNEVPPRKEFIYKNAREAELDI